MRHRLWQANPFLIKNPQTGEWEATGKVSDEYLLGYYQGTEKIVDKKTCKSVLDEATGQPKLDPRGKPVPDLSTGQLKDIPKFIRKKFGNLADEEREARFVLAKLANVEGEVLKLTGLDRSSYAQAMQQLRGWRADADLHLTVTDYLAAVSRLPAGARRFRGSYEVQTRPGLSHALPFTSLTNVGWSSRRT